MRKIKQTVALLLAPTLLAVFCGFSAPQCAYFADSGAQIPALQQSYLLPPFTSPADSGTQDLTGGVVTGFLYESAFSQLELESYPKGNLQPVYKWIDLLSAALDCTVTLPNGTTTGAFCTAVWNTSSVLRDEAGIYELTATLSPPPGTVFGPGVRTSLVFRVQILDDAAPVRIVSVEQWRPYSIAVAVTQGTAPEELENNLFFSDWRIDCTDENGSIHQSKVVWDFSTVNLNTTGVYTVHGTLAPLYGAVFPAGLALPQPVGTVSVQAPGKPEINCFWRSHPSIAFPWVAPPGELEAIRVWISEEDGPWTDITQEPSVQITESSLMLMTDLFTTGLLYRLQVDYDGGQTGILTFRCDENMLIEDYQTGDRDGGDTSGTPPTKPPVATPPPGGDGNNGEAAPPATGSGGASSGGTQSSSPDQLPEKPAYSLTDTPPAQNTAAPGGSIGAGQPAADNNGETESIPALAPSAQFKVIVEESGETFSILSGARLRLMTNGGAANFSKQGITVTLSASTLKALSVADNEPFEIQIQRIENNAFSFAVFVNDVPVTALSGTTVMLPYTAASTAPVLLLQNEYGETVAEGSYDAQLQIATFTVDASGRFTIVERLGEGAAPAQPDENGVPAVALTAAALLLAVGGLVLWKRRVGT